jgi:catechol 2,3-dioxygenase-like lactoylglutathione lyase family enzyme
MPCRAALILAAITLACVPCSCIAQSTPAQTIPAQGKPPAAQAPANVVPSPSLAGIAHIALRVHSLAGSVAFYQRLGFVKAFELSRNGQAYEAFIKINDRQFIELYPTDAKNPQPGFLHVCFVGDNLYAVHDFYVLQGLSPKPVRTAGAGNLLFTMPGPETPQGPQNMEYTQYMPGSLHSKDFGKNLSGTPDSTLDPNLDATHKPNELVSVTLQVADLAAAKAFYVQKLGFQNDGMKRSNAVLLIPGGSGQEIDLAKLEPEDQRATFRLAVSRPGATEPAPAELQVHTDLLFDPDGNSILITNYTRTR